MLYVISDLFLSFASSLFNESHKFTIHECNNDDMFNSAIELARCDWTRISSKRNIFTRHKGCSHNQLKEYTNSLAHVLMRISFCLSIRFLIQQSGLMLNIMKNLHCYHYPCCSYLSLILFLSKEEFICNTKLMSNWIHASKIGTYWNTSTWRTCSTFILVFFAM